MASGESYPFLKLTCTAHGPDAIFIESEALLQGLCPHVLVEHVTACEVQQGTEVLVMGNQTDVNATVGICCLCSCLFVTGVSAHTLVAV